MIKIIFILSIFINVLFINSTYGIDIFHKFYPKYTVEKNTNKVRTMSTGLILLDLTKYRDSSLKSSIYEDIMSHSKDKPFEDNHSRSTNAHETVHGINNQLRNFYKQHLKKNMNGFYAGEGKGILIENPKLTMRDIIPNIPMVVRGYRYDLYFVKQIGNWNEVPSYPIDEWAAYIAGAECAVDDTKKDIFIPKSDYVSGCLEFSIYCTALSISVAKNDPIFWKTNTQFKNAIQYFLIKAEKIFFEGQNKFPFNEQNRLLHNLRYHDDTKELRDFLLTEFQGVFVD
jgi:hypothetical protein